MTIDEIVEEFKNRNLIEWNSTAHSYRSRQQAMVEFLYEKLTDLRKQWLRDEMVKLEEILSVQEPETFGWEDGYSSAISNIIERYQAELNEKVI